MQQLPITTGQAQQHSPITTGQTRQQQQQQQHSPKRVWRSGEIVGHQQPLQWAQSYNLNGAMFTRHKLCAILHYFPYNSSYYSSHNSSHKSQLSVRISKFSLKPLIFRENERESPRRHTNKQTNINLTHAAQNSNNHLHSPESNCTSLSGHLLPLAGPPTDRPTDGSTDGSTDQLGDSIHWP